MKEQTMTDANTGWSIWRISKNAHKQKKEYSGVSGESYWPTAQLNWSPEKDWFDFFLLRRSICRTPHRKQKDKLWACLTNTIVLHNPQLLTTAEWGHNHTIRFQIGWLVVIIPLSTWWLHECEKCWSYQVYFTKEDFTRGLTLNITLQPTLTNKLKTWW